MLLVAAGVASRRGATVAGATLLAAGTLTTAASLQLWATARPSGEQTMARAIQAAIPGGAIVVVGGYWRLGLWYHLGGSKGDSRLTNVPTTAAQHPGWYDDGAAGAVNVEILELRRDLDREPRHTAVVVTPGMSTQRALEWLARSLDLLPAVDVPGGVLWLPRGSGPAPRSAPEPRQ